MELEYIRLKTSSLSKSKRSKPPIPKLPFLFLSFIFMLLILYYILIPSFKQLNIDAKIDPNLLSVLDNEKSATVIISGYNLHLDNCKKIWHFGNLTICEKEITKNELYKLAQNKKVLSIYLVSYKATFPMFKITKEQINDPDYRRMYSEDIDNEFLHVSGDYTGKGVTIAIIDTGIDYLHWDFYKPDGTTVIKALVSCIYKINGSCIVYNTSNWTRQDFIKLFLWEDKYKKEYGEYVFIDESGHGTHVAGIIAGQGTMSNGKYKGIAPDVKLVIIKAFHSDGTASLDDILDALQWVYDNAEKYNIKILSNSWGSAMPSTGNDPITLAINKIAKDKHIWIFQAAGNSGNYPGSITVPAISKYVITVGAWDCYKNKLAWFSSIGPTRTLTIKPDFVSCGVLIVAPKSEFAEFPDYLLVENGSYVALSGTSMATPTVSACAADFIQYYKEKYGKEPTLQDFIRFEEVNAIKLNFRKDWITGYGIVQCV